MKRLSTLALVALTLLAVFAGGCLCGLALRMAGQ